MPDTPTRRLVDLSMPVHADMLTFPRVPPPGAVRVRVPRGLRHAHRRRRVRRDLAHRELPGRPERPRRHAPATRASTSSRPPAGPRRSRSSTAISRRRPARLHRTRSRATGSRPRTSRRELDRIEYTLKPRDIVLDPHRRRAPTTPRSATAPTIPGMTADGDPLADRPGRAADGHRRHHLRPAGVGDVRAQAVLGGPPGDVGRGVLAPREPDATSSRSAAAARLHSCTSCRSSGSDHGGAGARRGDRSTDERRPLLRRGRLHLESPRPAARRLAGAHDRRSACRCRRASWCPPARSGRRSGRRLARPAARRCWPATSTRRRPRPPAGPDARDARSPTTWRGRSASAYAALGDETGGGGALERLRRGLRRRPRFAGQQDTYLHVRGAADVVGRVRDCWASFFAERALVYREPQGLAGRPRDGGRGAAMVEPEVAGVLFTVDPIARPARPDDRRGGARARRGSRLGPGHAGPLRRGPRRPGQEGAGRDPAVRRGAGRGRRGPSTSSSARSAAAPGRSRTPSWHGSRTSAATSRSASAGPRTSSGPSPAGSCTSCRSRPVTA